MSISTNARYALTLMQVLGDVPPPTLPQLIADGEDLARRVTMPEADPDSVTVPDDVEPDE